MTATTRKGWSHISSGTPPGETRVANESLTVEEPILSREVDTASAADQSTGSDGLEASSARFSVALELLPSTSYSTFSTMSAMSSPSLASPQAHAPHISLGSPLGQEQIPHIFLGGAASSTTTFGTGSRQKLQSQAAVREFLQKTADAALMAQESASKAGQSSSPSRSHAGSDGRTQRIRRAPKWADSEDGNGKRRKNSSKMSAPKYAQQTSSPTSSPTSPKLSPRAVSTPSFRTSPKDDDCGSSDVEWSPLVSRTDGTCSSDDTAPDQVEDVHYTQLHTPLEEMEKGGVRGLDSSHIGEAARIIASGDEVGPTFGDWRRACRLTVGHHSKELYEDEYGRPFYEWTAYVDENVFDPEAPAAFAPIPFPQTHHSNQKANQADFECTWQPTQVRLSPEATGPHSDTAAHPEKEMCTSDTDDMTTSQEPAPGTPPTTMTASDRLADATSAVAANVATSAETSPLSASMEVNSDMGPTRVKKSSLAKNESHGRVESVTFFLHESFVPNSITCTEPPYSVTRQGWGAFTMRIKVKLAYPGTSQKKPHTKTLELQHNLLLHKQEWARVYDIDLLTGKVVRRFKKHSENDGEGSPSGSIDEAGDESQLSEQGMAEVVVGEYDAENDRYQHIFPTTPPAIPSGAVNLLAANGAKYPLLPLVTAPAPPGPAVVQNWTTATQHAFWYMRARYWEFKSHCQCRDECRQRGLWCTGSAAELRDRLLRHDIYPATVLPFELIGKEASKGQFAPQSSGVPSSNHSEPAPLESAPHESIAAEKIAASSDAPTLNDASTPSASPDSASPGSAPTVTTSIAKGLLKSKARAAPRHTGAVLTLLKAVRKGHLPVMPEKPPAANLLTLTRPPRAAIKRKKADSTVAAEGNSSAALGGSPASRIININGSFVGNMSSAVETPAEKRPKCGGKTAADKPTSDAAIDDSAAETVHEKLALEKKKEKRKRQPKQGRQRHLDVGASSGKSAKQLAEDMATSSRNRSIGRRVTIFQQTDQTWYDGEVIGFRASTGLFLVLYDDGGKAWERMSGSDAKYTTACVQHSADAQALSCNRQKVAPVAVPLSETATVANGDEVMGYECSGCGRRFGKACWMGNHKKRCDGVGDVVSAASTDTTPPSPTLSLVQAAE